MLGLDLETWNVLWPSLLGAGVITAAMVWAGMVALKKVKTNA